MDRKLYDCESLTWLEPTTIASCTTIAQDVIHL